MWCTDSTRCHKFKQSTHWRAKVLEHHRAFQKQMLSLFAIICVGTWAQTTLSSAHHSKEEPNCRTVYTVINSSQQQILLQEVCETFGEEQSDSRACFNAL